MASRNVNVFVDEDPRVKLLKTSKVLVCGKNSTYVSADEVRDTCIWVMDNWMVSRLACLSQVFI